MRRIITQEEQPGRRRTDNSRLKAVAGMLLGLSYREMMELTALLQKHEGEGEYPVQIMAVAEEILEAEA